VDEVELAVAYVRAYLVRGARRVGGAGDAAEDSAVDAALRRLYDMVAEALGADPALVRAREQAARAGDGISERTVRRMTDALEEAVEGDPALGAALRRVIEEVRAETRTGIAEAPAGMMISGNLTIHADADSVAATQMGNVTLDRPAAATSGPSGPPGRESDRTVPAGGVPVAGETGNSYFVLLFVGATHHEEFLREVARQDPAARVAFRTRGAEVVETALVLTAPWPPSRVERLRATLRRAGAPEDIKVVMTEVTHWPYLLERLRADGPDQQVYHLEGVPSTTPVQDIGTAIVGRYENEDRPPRRRPVVIDHLRPDGDHARLDPDATLHDSGVREGGTLRVLPEATAGGGRVLVAGGHQVVGPGNIHSDWFVTGEREPTAELLGLAREKDLPAAAATIVSGLSALFLALGPPPEDADGELLTPTSDGSGGGRR